jgi:hypothetical protein
MSRVIQSTVRRLPFVIAASTSSVTRSGCAWAWTKASVTPHEPPQTSQWSTPRCSRNQLDVGHQVCGGVGRQVDMWPCRRGDIAPTVALVEQHDPVAGRVEVPAHARGGAGAVAAVQHHRRLPVRVAADLPVQRVPVADVERPGLVRLDRRVQRAHRRYRGAAAQSMQLRACGRAARRSAAIGRPHSTQRP